MPNTYAISALKDKRARLAGELKEAKRRVHQIKMSIVHADAVLRMLDEGYEPRSVRPKRTFTKNPAGLAKGQAVRVALDILRQSGERLNTNELARRVLAKLDKEVSPKALHMAGVTIQSSFSRHRTDTVAFDRSTYPGRWYLPE
jgi:hypothetical protein